MAVQPGLCLTWQGTPEDRFSHDTARIVFAKELAGLLDNQLQFNYASWVILHALLTADFFCQNLLLKKENVEYQKSVTQFGSRSGPI